MHSSSTAPDPACQITKVERLNKKVTDRDGNKKWIPSDSVKIAFSGVDLPFAVTIYHSYYKVKPFVAAPLQCYNCQRIGHTSKTCKSAARCLHCGGAHQKDACTKQQSDFCCVNCPDNHRSNDPVCPVFREAKDIEVIRAKTGKTFNEAKAEIRKPKKVYNNSSSQLPKTTAPSVNNTAFRNALTKKNPDSVERPGVEGACSPQVEDLSGFIAKTIRLCLIDLLKSLLPEGVANKANIESAVAETVQRHCGAHAPSTPDRSTGKGEKKDSPNKTQGSPKASASSSLAPYSNVFEDISDEEQSSQAGWHTVNSANANKRKKNSPPRPKKPNKKPYVNV